MKRLMLGLAISMAVPAMAFADEAKPTVAPTAKLNTATTAKTPAKKAATATTPAPVAAPAAGTKASANLNGIKQGGSVKAEGAHD